jgi:hypothetical protein
VVRANENGWINPHLIEDWIENCWKKWLWPQRNEDNLLILDSCKTHLSQEVKLKCSHYFQTSFIPKGMGGYLNPLELSVIKTFKAKLMKQWEQESLDRACGEATDQQDQRFSKGVESYVKICRWVLESWKQINPQVIMNGFAKAGIESFSSEEVVEAVINDDSVNISSNTTARQDSSNLAGYVGDENLVGDDFNGWT